jgi:hypothetical protein
MAEPWWFNATLSLLSASWLSPKVRSIEWINFYCTVIQPWSTIPVFA